MHIRGKRWLTAGLGGLFVATLLVAAPYAATLAFLLDVSGQAPQLRRWIPARMQSVSTRDGDIPTRHGLLRVRVYEPEAAPARTVVIFPGIHGGGVEEPRLARLCRQLASTGPRVVCAPLPELREFKITPSSTESIEDVTRWIAQSPVLAPSGRVSLVGVSFSGGLALVAAGSPTLAGKLDAVVSLGGHGLLSRTLRYLATGQLPDGTTRAPHDYGLAVVALASVEHLVPPEQMAALGAAIRTFLEASLDDSPTRARGMALLAEARRMGEALPEPGRAIMHAVAERDVRDLGARLSPHLSKVGTSPALSPELSPATTAPVFLLHGRDDNVIPSTETPLVAAYLQSAGNRRVKWLLTPLISHADILRSPGAGDIWRFIHFWTDIRVSTTQ